MNWSWWLPVRPYSAPRALAPSGPVSSNCMGEARV
jgi:hypothetical protein